MKDMGKKIIALVLVFAVLMALFAFYDLDISLTLVNTESTFGKFAQWASEIPIDFLLMMSFAILFMGRSEKKTFWSVLGAAICFLGTFEYGFFIFFFSVKYYSTTLALILGASVGVLMGIGALFLAKQMLNTHRTELIKAALIIVLAVLMEEAFVNVLKIVWSRPRMRDLTEPYASSFVSWYKPNSSALGGDSFPSGHTAKAAGACFYMLLCGVYQKLKGKGVFFFLAGLIWTVLIGLGRIILAAHFASDVTAGAFFMLLAFCISQALVNGIIYKQKKK